MVPALPLPATRSRDPFCAPGGMRTSTISVCARRPSPWQVGQAFFSRPLPLQRGQVRLNFMLPAICVTLPVPLHCGQATDPASLPPVPWQVRALLVAGDFDLGLRAADGLPETDVQAVFEIGAFLRLRLGFLAPPPPAVEELAEDVFERTCRPFRPAASSLHAAALRLRPARRGNLGKIEAVEIHVGMALGRRPPPAAAPGNPLSE